MPDREESSRPDRKLRLCHIADAHLGYRRFNRLNRNGVNQREADVSAAFRETVDRVLALKPDLTLIAGDLFHTVRPSNSVLTFCFREIRRLARTGGAPVVITSGNHESPRRADSGSPLRLLAEIEGVHVADHKIENFYFPQLSTAVTALPHAALLDLRGVSLRGNDSCQFNILLAHAQIGGGWMSDIGGAEVSLAQLAAHEWDYIALGHVHRMSEVGLSAAYSGSTEHTSFNFWGEASVNKGFLEVELPAGKRTFHALTSPREVVVLDDLDGAGADAAALMSLLRERIDNIAGGIEGKLVRLVIHNVTREVQRQLDFREFRKWRAAALHLALDLRTPDVRQPRLSRGNIGRLEDELASFCRDWKFAQVSHESAAELLQRYIKRMDEEDEASRPQS